MATPSSIHDVWRSCRSYRKEGGVHDPFADLVGLKPAARPSVPIRNVGSASGLSSASAGTPLDCGWDTWGSWALSIAWNSCLVLSGWQGPDVQGAVWSASVIIKQVFHCRICSRAEGRWPQGSCAAVSRDGLLRQHKLLTPERLCTPYVRHRVA